MARYATKKKKGLGLDEAQSLQQLSARINHGEAEGRGLCGEGGGRGVIKLGGKADDGRPNHSSDSTLHTRESRDGAPDLRQHNERFAGAELTLLDRVLVSLWCL